MKLFTVSKHLFTRFMLSMEPETSTANSIFGLSFLRTWPGAIVPYRRNTRFGMDQVWRVDAPKLLVMNILNTLAAFTWTRLASWIARGTLPDRPPWPLANWADAASRILSEASESLPQSFMSAGALFGSNICWMAW